MGGTHGNRLRGNETEFRRSEERRTVERQPKEVQDPKKHKKLRRWSAEAWAPMRRPRPLPKKLRRK